MEALRWETDRTGDTLWRGETFLGCIYNQDRWVSGTARRHGWRALEGEDLFVVGNALPTREQPDARMGARALLEAHVGAFLPLPSASELLEMTR